MTFRDNWENEIRTRDFEWRACRFSHAACFSSSPTLPPPRPPPMTQDILSVTQSQVDTLKGRLRVAEKWSTQRYSSLESRATESILALQREARELELIATQWRVRCAEKEAQLASVHEVMEGMREEIRCAEEKIALMDALFVEEQGTWAEALRALEAECERLRTREAPMREKVEGEKREQNSKRRQASRETAEKARVKDMEAQVRALEEELALARQASATAHEPVDDDMPRRVPAGRRSRAAAAAASKRARRARPPPTHQEVVTEQSAPSDVPADANIVVTDMEAVHPSGHGGRRASRRFSFLQEASVSRGSPVPDLTGGIGERFPTRAPTGASAGSDSQRDGEATVSRSTTGRRKLFSFVHSQRYIIPKARVPPVNLPI